MAFFGRVKAKLEEILSQNQTNSKENKDNHYETKKLKNSLPKIKFIAKEKIINGFLSNIRKKNGSGQVSLEYTIRQAMLKKGEIVLDKSNPDQLNCMICLNFLVHPVLMKCKHIACEYCLDEYALKELTCPVCKEALSYSKLFLSPSLEYAIAKQLAGETRQKSNHYLNTKKMRDAWRSKRYLSAFEVGMKIDIRDKKFEWGQGIIINITQSDNKSFLTVETQLEETTIRTDLLDSRSPRLAPFQLFSARKGLVTSSQQMLSNVRSMIAEFEAVRSARETLRQNTNVLAQNTNNNSSNDLNNPENIQNNNSEEQQRLLQRQRDREQYHPLICRFLGSAQNLQMMSQLMNTALLRQQESSAARNAPLPQVSQQVQQNSQQQQSQQQQLLVIEQVNAQINNFFNENDPNNNNNPVVLQQQQQQQQEQQQIPMIEEGNENVGEELEVNYDDEQQEIVNEDAEEDDEQDIESLSEFSYDVVDIVSIVDEWNKE